MNLNDVINATDGTPQIVSEQHDTSKINWQAAMGDLAECGGQGQTMAERAMNRANLNVNNGRVSMFGVGDTGWHQLGIVVASAINGEEAQKLANMGYLVEKVENHIPDGKGGWIPTGSYAIRRTDNMEVLNYGTSVGKDYTIWQVPESFDFMDEIVKGGAKYNTAGVLGKGEKWWMLAEMPQKIKIPGEEDTDTYLLLASAHDGSGSARVIPTSERPVCDNTLRIAIAKGRGKGFSVRHTKNMKARLQQAQESLQYVGKAIEEFQPKADALVRAQIEPVEYFHAFLDDVLDVTQSTLDIKPTRANFKNGKILQAILNIQDKSTKDAEEKRYAKVLRRRKDLLEDILTRYESDRNNGNEKIAGSSWAAFNAVTENVDHSPLWRGKGRSDNSEAQNEHLKRERRLESNLYGSGDDMKQEALSIALAATK